MNQHLSAQPFIHSDEITLNELTVLARLNALEISPNDLSQVLQHFQLVASHAKNVMTFPLDEAIEPAPEFKP